MYLNLANLISSITKWNILLGILLLPADFEGAGGGVRASADEVGVVEGGGATTARGNWNSWCVVEYGGATTAIETVGVVLSVVVLPQLEVTETVGVVECSVATTARCY